MLLFRSSKKESQHKNTMLYKIWFVKRQADGIKQQVTASNFKQEQVLENIGEIIQKVIPHFK